MNDPDRQTYATQLYKKVADDIKSMSREEMAVILHGFACQAQVIEREYVQRSSHARNAGGESECPSLNAIHRAMADLRSLAMFEDCVLRLENARVRTSGLGSVYVIEFSDGHVKIGQSITPEARIKSIAGSNQAALTRQWISAGLKRPFSIETAAHRHFRDARAGGEFFNVSFDTAVEWITNQVERELAIH